MRDSPIQASFQFLNGVANLSRTEDFDICQLCVEIFIRDLVNN